MTLVPPKYLSIMFLNQCDPHIIPNLKDREAEDQFLPMFMVVDSITNFITDIAGLRTK